MIVKQHTDPKLCGKIYLVIDEWPDMHPTCEEMYGACRSGRVITVFDHDRGSRLQLYEMHLAKISDVPTNVAQIERI